ncbi:MAG: Glycosyl transferase family 2 [Sporanaerobacter sp.]|uniref:glycosyltransferase n=1 Tax=Sporanaerobacter sp. TaxID=2010183 RepID=UPI003A103108
MSMNVVFPSNRFIKIEPDDLDRLSSKGVSVITPTNRLNCMYNIFNNFLNQSFLKKELIIILNNNLLNLNEWRKEASKYENENIRIYQLDEKISLGECLNYAVEKANYQIIAKFDDDDFYAHEYIKDSIKPFLYTEASIIGKSTTYIYFQKNNILAIKNPKRENRYTYRVEGATMLIDREVFQNVKFSDKNIGEDLQFCKDCIKEGYKIFSTNKYYYIYIRHNNHTWNIDDDELIKQCKVIGKLESPIDIPIF